VKEEIEGEGKKVAGFANVKKKLRLSCSEREKDVTEPSTDRTNQTVEKEVMILYILFVRMF
jgi:hypothetical protein